MADIELIQVMNNRAAMYNMLGRAFMEEADAQFIRELKSMHFPQGTGNDDIDAAYLALYKFLRHTKDSLLDDLAVDYARCFLGVGTMEARAAYPFESVYTSDKGLLMQTARDEVLAIFKSEGLADTLKNTANEGEDHLALELFFMRELAYRTAHFLETDDEESAADALLTQRNFLHDHISTWTPRWCSDVSKYCKQGFYPAFASLLAAYLPEDSALLEELVGEDEANDTRAAESADGAISSTYAGVTKNTFDKEN